VFEGEERSGRRRDAERARESTCERKRGIEAQGESLRGPGSGEPGWWMPRGKKRVVEVTIATTENQMDPHAVTVCLP